MKCIRSIKLLLDKYVQDKLQHALSCVYQLHNIKKMDADLLNFLLSEAVVTREWMVNNIAASREKDYTNEFRKMVYDNDAEMMNVLGDIKSNSFINDQQKKLKIFLKDVKGITKKIIQKN